jgi:hypothetical protein
LNFSNRIHRNFCATQAASKGQRHAELRRKICKLWRWRVDYSREKILTAASRITRGRLGARRKSYRPLAVKGARGPFEGRDTACTATESCTSHTHSYFFGRKFLSSRPRARPHPRSDRQPASNQARTHPASAGFEGKQRWPGASKHEPRAHHPGAFESAPFTFAVNKGVPQIQLVAPASASATNK